MDEFGLMRIEDDGTETPTGTFKTRAAANRKRDELANLGSSKFRVVSIDEYREAMH